MNYYFVRQSIYTIALLIVGKFINCNCYDLPDIVTDIENIVNNDGGILLLQNTDSNITFIPDENGRVEQCKDAVAWKGVLIEDDADARNPIVIKFLISEKAFSKECNILTALKANGNETVEDNKIPFVRFYRNVLNKYFALAISSFDETFDEVIENKRKLSPANLLRLFHHAVVALEYVHSCDVIHQNIEPNNFVYDYVRGKTFLYDFHLSALKKKSNIVTGRGNRIYCSVNRHLGKPESFLDDVIALYYVMLHYARVGLPWEINVDSSIDEELARAKKKFDEIRRLSEQTGPEAVQRVFKRFYDDIMEVAKSTPKGAKHSNRPNYTEIKKYIIDGFKKVTNSRDLNFVWDQNEALGEMEDNDENQIPSTPIPILPNGGTGRTKKGTTTLSLSGTCGFDSIFHLFLALYADIKELKESINQSDKPYDQLIVTAFNKNLNETINNRCKLLYKMFRKNFIQTGTNVKKMHCRSSITTNVYTASKHSDIIYSAKVYVICKRCNITHLEKTHVYMPLKAIKSWTNVSKDLQTYIDKINWKLARLCKKCKHIMRIKVKLNSILLIFTYKQGHRTPIKRDDITKTINVKGNEYEFRGAVEFIKYNRIAAHFVTHIKRNNNRWETYDDNKNKIIYTPLKFLSHMYVYAITNSNDADSSSIMTDP